MTLYIQEAPQGTPVWEGWQPLVQTVYLPEYSLLLVTKSFVPNIVGTVDQFYALCRPFLPVDVRHTIFPWISHLVSNSLDAAIANGLRNPITLGMHRKDQLLSLDVVDSSGGFSQEALAFEFGPTAGNYPSKKASLSVPQVGIAGEELNIVHTEVGRLGGEVVKGNYHNARTRTQGAFVRILLAEDSFGTQ